MHSVILPGSSGEYGITANHVPYVAQLEVMGAKSPRIILLSFAGCVVVAALASLPAARRAAAGFPTGKTFDVWNEAASSIPAPTQAALRTLEWVHRRENLVVCGPSGTGKTFFAKAIATAIDATAIVVSGPELKSKWVGESERNMREAIRLLAVDPLLPDEIVP